MKVFSKVKGQIEKLPEFSEKNYSIAGYVLAAIITVTGGFLVYEVITTKALTFSANWNMFNSAFGSFCIIIGFILAMVWWGKLGHYSAKPIVETRDRYGNLLERKENYDVIEQGFAKFLLPILGHFVFEPILYGAIIYYPIQCVIALVGAIFPYVLSLAVLAIIVGSWLFTRYIQFRYRSTLLVLCGLVFSVAFGWGGYAIMKSGENSNIQMLADNQQVSLPISSEQIEVIDDANANEDGTVGEAETQIGDDDIDDQFDGVGEEGLFGSLSIGTTEYVGDMAGFPIEFTITKNDGSISAVYKNVKYSTKMNLSGESLPADGGNITFFGSDGKNNWTFNLTGNAENISGVAQSNDGKELQVTLHKK